MSHAEIAALVALCAALASAIGDVVRQRSAHEITDQHVGHLRLFGMSLRDARWWLGGLMAVLNYSLQALALVWASVMLVTSLQVTALLFALPIYARLAHHGITRRQWTWAVILAAALAVVIIRDPASGQERASLHTWMIVAAVLGPALVLCVLAARKWAGRPIAAVLLALVAGSSLALFAVLTKGAVEVAEDGVGALMRAPETYALLPAALSGMIFQQSAFRAGALTASLPTMTVAKPVVAAVLGITVLGETLHAYGAELFVLLVAVAVVVTATVALARGEAATMEADALLDEPVDGPLESPESPAGDDAGSPEQPVVAGDGPVWDAPSAR